MLKSLDLLEWTPDGGFGCMCVELPAGERLGCKADDDTKASQELRSPLQGQLVTLFRGGGGW